MKTSEALGEAQLLVYKGQREIAFAMAAFANSAFRRAGEILARYSTGTLLP